MLSDRMIHKSVKGFWIWLAIVAAVLANAKAPFAGAAESNPASKFCFALLTWSMEARVYSRLDFRTIDSVRLVLAPCGQDARGAFDISGHMVLHEPPSFERFAH